MLRYRDPEQISPINGTEELLLAIYELLLGLRADLRAGAQPAASEPAADVAPESTTPAPAPKARARKKKVTTRKKA